MIQFRVPCIPIAQPRQRTSVIGGRPHNYTPTKHPVNAFKAAVKQAYSEASKNAPIIDDAIELDVFFVLPRPKAMIWKKKEMKRILHKKKPDLDNLTKSVMDALSGLAWRDDSQISAQKSVKVIADGSEAPFVHIRIRHYTIEQLHDVTI